MLTTVTPKMTTKTSEPTPITITTMAHCGMGRSSSGNSTFECKFLAITIREQNYIGSEDIGSFCVHNTHH